MTDDRLPIWYPVLCVFESMLGVGLITAGAWWGWIYALIGVGGLVFWTVMRRLD